MLHFGPSLIFSLGGGLPRTASRGPLQTTLTLSPRQSPPCYTGSVSIYRVTTWEEFGPAVEGLLNRAVRVLQEELRAEIAERALVKLVDLSPVGDPAVDEHAGKYRASHIPSVGEIAVKFLPNMPSYPVPGVEAVSAVLRGSDPAESVFIANSARNEESGYPYGKDALEPGRRQYTRLGSGTTMWIGSVQAPEGIYGPAVRALLGMRGTIEATAVRRAKERL